MPLFGEFLKLRRAMYGLSTDCAILTIRFFMIFTADSACSFARELPGAILSC